MPAGRLMFYKDGENLIPITPETPMPTATTVELEAADIQIGAVELKNADSDDRAVVDVDGALLTTDKITAGTATDTTDVAVAGTAVQLLATNATRKSALIQNVGDAAMRVTTDGSTPTATHGKRLVAGAALSLTSPYCPTAAVSAIRETATSTTANASEVS